MRQAQSYEEIEPLIKFCKAGRIFDVQEWIAAGKPLDLTPEANEKRRRKSPLQVALDSGFHSLIQVLLEGGAVFEEPRYSALEHAIALRRLDLVQMLVHYGARIHSVDMSIVFDTWSKEIVEFFIDNGADLDTGNPLAYALCSRIRPVLGIYKRYKERFPSFQEQINIALRYHSKDGNLKWVSLMLWAGADPYAKGPDSPYEAESDPDEYSCALELAALYGHTDIFNLKSIKLNPAHPNARNILRRAMYGGKSELLKRLLEKGFTPRDLEDQGSSLIQSQLISMTWCFDRYLLSRKEKDIDSSNSREGIKMIHMLVRHGARWEPEDRSDIHYARRFLLRMIPEYTMEFVWIMSEYKACSLATIEELIKSPTMRAHVSMQRNRLNEMMNSLRESDPV